jgi:hypothetical protein
VTIALLTEDGPSGEAIRILAEKCLKKTGRPLKIIRRCINRGDIFTNPRKLAALIKQVNVKEETKTIVCVDSECTDPKLTEKNLQSTKKALTELKVVVDFVIIVHALETWLAADEEALRAVIKPKIPLKVPGNLENECRPGSIFKEIYRKHGKGDFNKSNDDIIIANHADPNRIAKRCSSFKKFQQLLLS